MKTTTTRPFPLPLFILLGLLYVIPATLWGQDTTQSAIGIREDFSDVELRSFVKANEKVSAIQQQAEQKMIKAIEDEGLSVERFHEILEQQRDPSRTTETPVDELASFNNAAQVILDENERIEKQMTASIEDEGIDIETYKQIMLAYQQSPAIKTKVNKMVNGEN